MELTPPKAILFDWDNTLIDSWPVIHEALTHCLTQMDHPLWTLDETKARVARSMREEFPKLFGDRWQEAAQHYQQGYLRVHLDRLTPYAGALDTIRQIHHAKLYQAVVSNKKGDTLRKEAQALNWLPYFHAFIGAQDASHDKPHPAHAHKALERYTLPYGDDIWFIGDSNVDMEIAEKACFTPIFYGTEEKAATISYPIAAQVGNHYELQQLLTTYLP